MKTIIVDDDLWMIKRFEMESADIEDIKLQKSFTNPYEALEYVKDEKHTVELAFLDIEMPGMSGLELGAELKKLRPGIVIFYLSAHDIYMVEAFRSRSADYYILKPYSHDDLQDAAHRAKLLSVRQKKRIYIETFGSFNIYLDGQILLFKSRIAKEIMALLVHKRGTALNNKEAFYIIWEDAPYTHEKATGFRKGIRKLKDVLEAAGISDILISSGKEHSLDISKVDCDYYDFLNGDIEATKKFNGEYMLDYSWGEETTAELIAIKNGRNTT